jgi:serine/threonine-protein kinase
VKSTDSAATTDELWQRVSSIFADAIELPPAERERFLRQACAGAGSVGKEVRRLLFEHDRAGHFLETPALGAVTPLAGPGGEEHVCREGDVLAGRFHVVRLLGAGGMGEVYEAYDSELKQRVAIKTLRGPGVLHAGMLDRFRSEVMRARQITHRSVSPVYDLFTHTRGDGSEVPFFTMKLLEGETLAQFIARRGPLSTTEALPLLEQMASALHTAHEAGIVHRDFKPGNVFILTAPGKTPRAIVADFGIAAEFGTAGVPGSLEDCSGAVSVLAGTPAYMAPEQITGDSNSPASDIYALGLVAYEMLTGKRAYAAASPLASALQKLAPNDPRLFTEGDKIPQAWVYAIHRAVRRNPAERFADALEFVAAISPKERVFSRRLLLARGFWLMVSLAVAISGAIAFVLGRSAPETATTASIAVLPFENLSGEPQIAYFSDGVAEELTTALTAYPKLHVAARNAAFAYRNSSGPLSKISQSLGVGMLLTGSVRRTENRVHISVQLVRGSTGRQVWSQIYDRDMRQVFALEGEITAEIAARLALGQAPRKARREPTANMEAYDLFLKGRSFWNTRTREGVMKGLAFFQQAIGLDNQFALAYTGLADAYIVLVDYGWLAPIEAAPKIRGALERSLAIEPDSADTQASLGLFKNLIEWDQAGAERAFQRALALQPSLLTAHSWYGNYLMRARRLDEALREAEAARRLDPVSMPTLVFLGWVRYYRREYAAAIEIGKQAIELNPSFPHGHMLLALSYASMGRKDEALRSTAAAVLLTGDKAVGLRHQASVFSLIPGLAAEARQAAERLEATSQDRQAGYLVIVYGGLGDRDRMYHWADRAIQIRDTSLLMANIAPALEQYRQEPRFREVLRQLGYLQ